MIAGEYLLNGCDGGYTYITNASPRTASRIDRFYCSENALDLVKKSSLSASFSDHLALTIELATNEHKRRKSPYWRFNNHLLNDDDFIECMRNFLKNQIENRRLDSDPLTWWENFKNDIKMITIQFSRQKRQTAMYHYKCLNEQLNDASDLDRMYNVTNHAREAMKKSSEKY